jgi:thiosulfate reductase / polysulfide reductase chain A
MDTTQKPFYEYYNWELTEQELEGASLDAATRIYTKADASGRERAIGIHVDGKARRGFPTPSRKFTIRHPDLIEAGKKVGWPDDGLPRFVPIPAHENMPDDRLHLVSFKWNVHTQARTAPQKYLTEIVHDNPVWINTRTAARLGIKTGDHVEITTYRPKGATYQPSGEKVGSAIVRAFVTNGIHPRVLAISNSVGHKFGGRAATATNGPRPKNAGFATDTKGEDSDLVSRVWWDRATGGRGAGYNINAILPIQPSPLVGMQAWYDTTCTIRRV